MVRVTQTMINQNVLRSIQNNITHMAVLQEKLATGRRISRPSDSPIDFTLSLSIRANITQGRTFMRNINSARTSLEIAETTMGNLTETLKDVRTLALQGANNVDYNGRLAIANQISEMYEHVLSLANTGYNGRRIFGGTQSKDEPFIGKGGSVLYLGDDFDQNVLVGKGNQIKTNLNGFETFLHTPNTITGSIKIKDTSAPLAEQLRAANPNFPNLPAFVDPLTGATVERSPNPSNSPTVLPNNYASFWIHDKEIKVDLSVDSLEDVVTRINANVNDVMASINDSNQLVITSRRSDSLVLQDGSRNIGFEAELPQQANILSALGMHQIVPGGRSLNLGFPATDPLVDGTTLPTPSRSAVDLASGTFLFVASETGPSNSVSTPFADNMALSDVDLDGNEQVDANGNPVFINKLEALRITINEDVYDIDLRSLTEGTDFDGLSGNFDDIPGSDLGDLYNLINNHPDLKGKVTAYTNKDGYGMEISAVNSTDLFKVENLRKMFGRDITTRVTVDALGEQTITREGVITRDTALDDLPGTMIDPAANMGSLGIRRADPLPAGMPPAMNKGLIVITNGEFTEAVDLRDAETIGDVLDRINDSKTGVRAKVNQWGTGLEIEGFIAAAHPDESPRILPQR